MTNTIRTLTIPDRASTHLTRVDPVMRELMSRCGTVEYRIDPDLWRAVIGSIVGQQLSLTAAATIRSRVAALGSNGFPTPAEILALPEETLRGCGLSRAKTSYVREAARSWEAGEIVAPDIVGLDDELVIDRLVTLRGVGRWTAEMVLIFSLGRDDVLAVDDLGIRTAVQRAYGLPERPGKAEVLSIGEPWKPFRSYASLYLWHSLKL